MVKHAAFVKEVGTVGDAEGFVDVVVGDKNTDVAVLEMGDDVLNVLHGDGVDTGKRLVEEEELGVVGQCASYLGAAAFATGKLDAFAAANLLKTKFGDEGLELFFPLGCCEVFAELEDGHDIVLDGHVAKDGGLLCQIANTKLGTAVHGHFGDFTVVEKHTSGVGLDDAHYHIECGGLASTVGTQQAYYLALLHTDADFFYYGARAVYLDYVFGSELHMLIC